MSTTEERDANNRALAGLVLATGGHVFLNGRAMEPERRMFDIIDIAAMAAAVDAAGPVKFLISPLWPGDAYGVIGAEKKAGKTWADLDLAVSVALGLEWFGRYGVERPGRVVVFAGEGGKRNIIRRLRAIVEHKGAQLGELTGLLRISERVPKLTDAAALAAIAEDLRENPGTVVGIIDPLYLAASGSKGSDLYAMGEALSGIQQVYQDAGSALLVTTHWNKTGRGTGADRFTGSGPAEWGRVLGSAAIEQSSTTEGRSEVELHWEFTGSEIPDTEFRIVRKVWSDDPIDLMSALHYEVTVTHEGSDFAGQMTHTQQRVLDALDGTDVEKATTVKDIMNTVARDGNGPPLRKQTVQDALNALKARDLARSAILGRGKTVPWWRAPMDYAYLGA